MVIVLGIITLESETEADGLLPVFASRARRSRADAGNIEYVFSRSLEHPREIRLTERWESESSLMEHLQKPDPEFREALATARISQAIVTAYDGVNERVLMTR